VLCIEASGPRSGTVASLTAADDATTTVPYGTRSDMGGGALSSATTAMLIKHKLSHASYITESNKFHKYA